MVENVYFKAALNRERPTTLEIILLLAPHTHTQIKIDFEKTFLKYTEFPPDANRGFDIGSSVLTFEQKNETMRLYTDNILIALPTPDFSMPYNVITLTCTLLALYFGGMMNLLMNTIHPIASLKKKNH